MTKALTELQLAILRALWQSGEATVSEVQRALRPERELAITTIATMISRLEKDGAVTHRTEGRTYHYRAVLSENEARGETITDVVSRFFGGDSAALVAHLLDDAQSSPDELERLKALIAAWEAKQNE